MLRLLYFCSCYTRSGQRREQRGHHKKQEMMQDVICLVFKSQQKPFILTVMSPLFSFLCILSLYPFISWVVFALYSSSSSPIFQGTVSHNLWKDWLHRQTRSIFIHYFFTSFKFVLSVFNKKTDCKSEEHARNKTDEFWNEWNLHKEMTGRLSFLFRASRS